MEPSRPYPREPAAMKSHPFSNRAHRQQGRDKLGVAPNNTAGRTAQNEHNGAHKKNKRQRAAERITRLRRARASSEAVVGNGPDTEAREHAEPEDGEILPSHKPSASLPGPDNRGARGNGKGKRFRNGDFGHRPSAAKVLGEGAGVANNGNGFDIPIRSAEGGTVRDAQAFNGALARRSTAPSPRIKPEQHESTAGVVHDEERGFRLEFLGRVNDLFVSMG